ncbi:hypothetical protein D3C73_883470 [compost metagenome]
MLVRHVEFLLGTHHAVAFDAANLADAKRHVETRNIVARTCQRTDKPGAGIRRTANDLQRLAAIDVRTGIDGKNPETVGLWMLFSGQDFGDDEGLVGRLVIDILDFEADRREALADLVEGGVGLKMILEPGKREFHDLIPSVTGSDRRTGSACRAGGSRNGSSSEHRR